MSSIGNEKATERNEELIESKAAEVKVVTGSEAYNQAIRKERPSFRKPVTWQLLAAVLLGCFCQTMNGFDDYANQPHYSYISRKRAVMLKLHQGAIFGGLTANSYFLDFFHGSPDGAWAAINSAMYQIGGVVALPFVGPAVDTWGRKVGMLIGASIIVIGTILNGTTVYLDWPANVQQLKAGRFILGFGVSIVSGAGPIYVVEIAHPAWRGVITAYCNTFWFVGSILSSSAIRGGLNLTGTVTWQIPVWLQMFFPGLIMLFVWFIPESPRWDFVNNKGQRAIATLTKYHGYGNPESAWVKLQLSEYEEFLNGDGADKRWWDYSALFKSRTRSYRIACNCIFVIAAQWAGNGVLTYFLPAVLETAGYRGDVTQANINLGYSCFQFVFALIGAALPDRVGRRPMMLCSMASCAVVWIGVTSSSAVFNQSDEENTSAAKATIACIFLFGAVFSIGITPLQALYPVEVLSYEMRAKGMAFSSLSVNAAGLLNQFAWPIALQRIGWHTYIVFVVWDAIQWLIFYFVLPETKKRTLEELDVVFESKNPVRTSLVPHKVAFDSEGSVVAAEHA